MKLSELKKEPAAPRPVVELGTSAVPSAPAEPLAEEPQGSVTETTPSGIEVYYQPAREKQRRLYKLCDPTVVDSGVDPWVEVPSVTTVLGVLDKSGPLTWWGMKVGAEGCIQLMREHGHTEIYNYPLAQVLELLTEHKLTVNHVKDKAADRGVNVHGALEDWFANASIPTEKGIEQDWPGHERGYVRGLTEFLLAIDSGAVADHAELMVGSLQHQYAGRFDLVLTLSRPVEVVTRCYPKKPPKIEEIPAGRYLLDLKTSKRIYDTHYLQLEAYEAAAVECGYAPTDHRGVVHVTADGKYELALNKHWTFEDFLAVRQCYRVMNERQIVQTFLDDLDATEVKS